METGLLPRRIKADVLSEINNIFFSLSRPERAHKADDAAFSRRILFLHRVLMLPVGSRTKRLHLPLSRCFISSREGGEIKMIWTGLSSFLSALKGNCGTMRLDQKGKAKEG